MNTLEKMSLEEFYAKHDCLFAMSGYVLDKCRFPHGRTQRQQKRDAIQTEKVGREYEEKRKEVRELYNKLISEGKLIPKTREEKLIETANGHPDNPSVQAARRVCEKKGIVWNIRKA